MAAFRGGALPSLVAQAIRFLRGHPGFVRTSVVLVFFLVWEWAAGDANPLLMTTPSKVAVAAWEMTVSGELPSALLASSTAFAVGIAVTIAGGFILGVLMGYFWPLEYVIDPFVNALIAVPRVALVPLLILWFGLDLAGKTVIQTLVAIFPVIINTYAGVKNVRGGLLEIASAFGANGWQSFVKVVLPAAAPFVLAGVRLAVGLAIIGMILAEFFTQITGLGGLIISYSHQHAIAEMLVPIVMLGLLGIGITQLVALCERRVMHWRMLEQERIR